MFGTSNFGKLTDFVMRKSFNSKLLIEYMDDLKHENDRALLDGHKAPNNLNSIVEELLWTLISKGHGIGLDLIFELDFQDIEITDVKLISYIMNENVPHYDVNDLATRWDHKSCSRVFMWSFVERYMKELETSRLCKFAIRAALSKQDFHLNELVDEIMRRDDVSDNCHQSMVSIEVIRRIFTDRGISFKAPEEKITSISRILFTEKTDLMADFDGDKLTSIDIISRQ